MDDQEFDGGKATSTWYIRIRNGHYFGQYDYTNTDFVDLQAFVPRLAWIGNIGPASDGETVPQPHQLRPEQVADPPS